MANLKEKEAPRKFYEGPKKVRGTKESGEPHRFKFVALGRVNICPNQRCMKVTQSIIFYPPSDGPGGHTKAYIACGQCGAPVAVEIPLFTATPKKGA
jgi:hypothetical protein